MEKAKFDALLPIIISSLIKKIAKKKDITHDESIDLLYNSKLYDLLETEEMKIWTFSVDKLYSLLEEELTTGKFELPDY